MKNFMKKIALVAIAFLAFSCSKDEQPSLGASSIAASAKATPELSSFVEALQITGLTSTFESAGNYTVLVPNNEAFSAVLSAYGVNSLADFETQNPGVLAKVLKYHVLTSRALSTSLTNNQSVNTLFEQPFTVSITPVAPIDATYLGETNIITLTGNNNDFPTNANVTARDINCTNGIIHTIDAVLVPAGL
jgi:uncharacterized surface protein with fasciclin (FAS1) repeats